MSRRPRRNHTPGFKAKVALAAVKGDRTIAQLAEHFDVHVKSLHAKIGELTLENDFLEGALTKAGLLSAKR
jgi:transposase